MAAKRRRLSRSGEFDRVYRDGSSSATRHLVLYSFPRDQDEEAGVRLGVSASRKVDSSVERNRVKRILREAFWGLSDRLPADYAFVLVARPEIGELIERDGMDGVRASIEEARARRQARRPRKYGRASAERLAVGPSQVNPPFWAAIPAYPRWVSPATPRRC